MKMLIGFGCIAVIVIVSIIMLAKRRTAVNAVFDELVAKASKREGRPLTSLELDAMRERAGVLIDSKDGRAMKILAAAKKK